MRERDWQRFWSRIMGVWETYSKRGLLGLVVVAIREKDEGEGEWDLDGHAKYRLIGGIAERGALLAALEAARLNLVAEMMVEHEGEQAEPPER